MKPTVDRRHESQDGKKCLRSHLPGPTTKQSAGRETRPRRRGRMMKALLASSKIIERHSFRLVVLTLVLIALTVVLAILTWRLALP